MQVKDLDIDSGCTPLLNSYLKLNVPEYITGCFTYFLMGMSEITYLEKKKSTFKKYKYWTKWLNYSKSSSCK